MSPNLKVFSDGDVIRVQVSYRNGQDVTTLERTEHGLRPTKVLFSDKYCSYTGGGGCITPDVIEALRERGETVIVPPKEEVPADAMVP